MMSSSKKDNNDEKLRMEVKRLKEELKKKDEKIQRFKKELANNSVVERWKLGKYLHDNLAQELTSVKISIYLLRNEISDRGLTNTFDEIIEIFDKSIDDVRNLSHDIIPMDVEKEGMEHAFNHLKFQAEKQHSIKCELETDEILYKITSREVSTNLYYITQEAIKNAVNHGEAENVKIALGEREKQLFLYIKDDGKGLESGTKDSGMGITIMKQRAEEIGGTLTIRNAEEEDYTTSVTCVLPLESLTGS